MRVDLGMTLLQSSFEYRNCVYRVIGDVPERRRDEDSVESPSTRLLARPDVYSYSSAAIYTAHWRSFPTSPTQLSIHPSSTSFLPRSSVLELSSILLHHLYNPLLPPAPPQPFLPSLVLLIPHLQLPQPPFPLLHSLPLLNQLLIFLPLNPILLPVYVARDQHGEREGLRVKSPPEIHVGRFVVALAHAPRGAYDSPHSKAAAERDEGFFAEAADEFGGAIFIVEVAGCGLVSILVLGQVWVDVRVLVKGRGQRGAVR